MFPINVEADQGSRWYEGQYEVWSLEGNCRVAQGGVNAQSTAAVIWINRAEPRSDALSKVIVYLEGEVIVDFSHQQPMHRATGKQANTITSQSWMGQFDSMAMVNVRVSQTAAVQPTKPPFVQRGVAAWDTDVNLRVQQAQFIPEIPPLLPAGEPQPTARSLQIKSRSSVPLQSKSYAGRTPDETAIVSSGGVRAIVRGIQNVEGLESDTVTLEADRVVVWTNSLAGLSIGGDTSQPIDGRWEFYLEGNIIFREGDRLIYADRMYYDVNQNSGTILNAEMLTPVDDYEGLMRLKADVLRQLDKQNFLAYGAAVTSSRMGVPRYWVQANQVTFQDVQTPAVNPFTGQAAIDPRTQAPAVNHEMLATSRNNFIYIGGLPVLYWPVIATDLTKPTYYLDGIRIKNDSVYGTQLLFDWDMYQLLGIREPIEGTQWTISTDYLSERGPGLGTNFNYIRPGAFWLDGPTSGVLDLWGIKDNGRDNLGADRRSLIPEKEYRGRALWQHRQYLPHDIQFTAEVGWISDRNFLEQYYEHEWDLLKDQTTGIELKRYVNNSSWSVSSDVRLNDFFTQTEWLPRLDHTIIGQSFLFDRLTWHAHSHAGYAKLQVASPPNTVLNPTEGFPNFALLPWEVPVEGIHAATRHEVDLPINLGPAKVVPYAVGEIFKVGEDIAGNEAIRTYGQAGVRASLPFWKANPSIQNQLFNLNGLAHKVVVDGEFLWADADENLGRFPLYEQLDDDSVEFFRRRFLGSTFMGLPSIPPMFSERNFAFRSGLQSWVTAPSTEIVDDLMKANVGVRQRWQTKRGAPGQERIVDWVTLDVQASYFPKATRDNFSQEFGMLDYDFRWHVGDRVTLLSDGYADLFGGGLRTVSLGGFITRPARGNVYLGMRSIEGPISSSILSGSVSYRMSEKWIVAAGGAVDLGATGNIGQTFTLTRIGESALIQLGFNVDESRGNIGASFIIEPRFMPSGRLGDVAGVQIPPAGAYGLE